MRRSLPPRVLVAALCVLVSSGLSGCGSSTGNVSGTVKFNGKPASLEGLQVSFMGENGRPICAVIEENGTYRAVGVQRGENKVTLAYMPSDVSDAMAERAKRLKPGDPANPAQLSPEEARQRAKDLEERAKAGGGLAAPRGFKNPIPERYRDPRESPLTLTVKGGKDIVFDIDVTP